MPISVGLRGEAAVVVDQHNTASGMGTGNVPALSTASLVALMERAAINAIRRHLEEGQETVGTAIDVKHVAATPVGKRVRAEAEVIAVEGNRVRFAVRGFDAVEQVGAGTHERVLIDKESFVWKMASKGA